MDTIKSLLTMEGRINRLRYFKYSLIVNCIGWPIALVLASILSVSIAETDDEFIIILTLLGSIFAIALVLPFTICLGVRRLHDLNQSGLLMLINLIPYIGGTVLGIYLLFFKGTDGPNKYGPDPLQSWDGVASVGYGDAPASDVQSASVADNYVKNAPVAEKSRFCSNCGTRLDVGVKFCPNCGANTNDA